MWIVLIKVDVPKRSANQTCCVHHSLSEQAGVRHKSCCWVASSANCDPRDCGLRQAVTEATTCVEQKARRPAAAAAVLLLQSPAILSHSSAGCLETWSPGPERFREAVRSGFMRKGRHQLSLDDCSLVCRGATGLGAVYAG